MERSIELKIPPGLPSHSFLRTILEGLRTTVEDAIVEFIKGSGVNDLMLKQCVMFHFISDEDSEFVSRVLLDRTVAIDARDDTYYLKFKDIHVDLLIAVLEELESGRYITMDVNLPLPEGITTAQ